MSFLEADFQTVATQSRAAAAAMATVTSDEKNAALALIAQALRGNSTEIVAANEIDLQRGRDAGLSESLIDRLALTADRIEAIADAVVAVVELPDPVGEILRGFTLPNGLEVRQVRVPMGVIGIIYEARPNVTVDAAALCIKSGNAALLRGSSSAAETNRILVRVIREALAESALPVDAVAMVPGLSRDSVKELLSARGLVDVIIPRGGAGLINSVVENSIVPVIETGVGNCHLYVDESADVETALGILVNGKVSRPSVCNSLETLLVHQNADPGLLPAALQALSTHGVTIHADAQVAEIAESHGIATVPATDEDWAAEYLSLDIAVAQVPDVAAAISHIRRWSSGHTEVIVADSAHAIRQFCAEVDSAAVMVNASSRFTDGGEFGFGAEIGISTQKLHARGPMGLPEMTTTKYVVFGDGQVRS